MAVLSVWAAVCTTRQFWYGALRSEARIHPGHAAVIFGHVWAARNGIPHRVPFRLPLADLLS